MDELVLARACAAGNERAWEVFLTRYRNTLYESAYKIAPTESTARELADSLYAELYGVDAKGQQRTSKLLYYQGRGSLQGWLRVVVAQEYINRYRSVRRESSLDAAVEDGAQFAAPVPDVAVADPRVEAAVTAELATLDADERFLVGGLLPGPPDPGRDCEAAGSARIHDQPTARAPHGERAKEHPQAHDAGWDVGAPGRRGDGRRGRARPARGGARDFAARFVEFGVLSREGRTAGMNEKLPNSMLDALAREAKPAEHPSADVLAAFVERALAEGEKQSVTDHLARCGECREVVFLASGAAEETSVEQQAAAAAPIRPRWRWSLAWAAPLAAVLLLVGGYFVWHGTERVATGPELASKTVAEAPVRTPEPSRDVFATQAAPPAVSSSVAKSPAMAAPAMTAPDKKAQPLSAGVVARNAAPPPPAESKQPTAEAESPNAAPQAPAIAIGGAMAAPPAVAPKANAFAQSESEAAQQYGNADSISVAVNRLATSAAKAAHPNWRITPQGKLEHLTSDGWTQVLPDQKRVVSSRLHYREPRMGRWRRRGALSFQRRRSALEQGRRSQPERAPRQRRSFRSASTIRCMEKSAHYSGSSYVTTDGGTTWTKQ